VVAELPDALRTLGGGLRRTNGDSALGCQVMTQDELLEGGSAKLMTAW
jgi:hypothetical protein